MVLVGRGNERACSGIRCAGIPVPLGIQPAAWPQVGGGRVRIAPVVLHGAPQRTVCAVQVRWPRIAVNALPRSPARAPGTCAAVERIALNRLVVVVAILLVVRKIDGQIIGGRKAERGVEGREIRAALVDPQVVVVVVTVHGLLGDAEPGVHGVAQRHIDHAANILLTVVRRPQREAGGKFRPRLGSDDVDQAARNVLSEQRALGTAQHFDPLDIHGGHVTAKGVRDVVPVDIHAAAERKYRIRMPATDASNHDTRVIGAVGLRQRDVGNEITDILDGIDARRFHRIGIDRRDGQWQVLQILFAPSCGDDDLFQHGLSGCALRCSLLPW